MRVDVPPLKRTQYSNCPPRTSTSLPLPGAAHERIHSSVRISAGLERTFVAPLRSEHDSDLALARHAPLRRRVVEGQLQTRDLVDTFGRPFAESARFASSRASVASRCAGRVRWRPRRRRPTSFRPSLISRTRRALTTPTTRLTGPCRREIIPLLGPRELCSISCVNRFFRYESCGPASPDARQGLHRG